MDKLAHPPSTCTKNNDNPEPQIAALINNPVLICSNNRIPVMLVDAEAYPPCAGLLYSHRSALDNSLLNTYSRNQCASPRFLATQTVIAL